MMILRFSWRISRCKTTDHFSLKRFLHNSESIFLIKNAHYDGVYDLVLNRPSVRNALDTKTVTDMNKAVDEISNSKKIVKMLILRSSTPKMFCSGADLKERKSIPTEKVAEVVSNISLTFQKLSATPFPVISIVDGMALGGGFELALSSDIIICTKNAMFGLPETKLGIIPGAGGTQRLVKKIGLAKGCELIFTGKIINAEEAFKLGIVNAVVDDLSEIENHSIISSICDNSPFAIRVAKQSIYEGQFRDVNKALDTEKYYYSKTIVCEDRLEGLRAFAEKRKPKFTGK